MKSDGLLKPGIIALMIALMIYAVAYFGIEHRRQRQGPWEATFTTNASNIPVLIVNQPSLGITNLQFVFDGAQVQPDFHPATLRFETPRPTPFPLPIGRCIFMDAMTMPGTIVFDLFGHEIQLLPRVLTVDKAEQPWRSDATILLPAARSSTNGSL